MKMLVVVCGAVLALGGAVRADTVVLDANFESPAYALGSLDGQNGWAMWPNNAGTVVDTDASQGTQSLANTVGVPLGFEHALSQTIPVGTAFHFSADVKGKVYVNILAETASITEFGFDSWTPGFYAWGGTDGGVQEGSKPDTDRWITVWGKFYDAGGGNKVADLGWCELGQTPFVDGQRVTAYNSKNLDATKLWIVAGGGAGAVGVDNVHITAVPEPSAIVLLAVSSFSLLAYAWRKHR